MYDDDVRTPISLVANDRYYKVAKFPTKNIKTPIVLLYGDADSLVDIDVMLKELPSHTIATAVPSFEHLDFIWAEDVHSLIFPTIFRFLNFYASKEEGNQWKKDGSQEHGLQSAAVSTTMKITKF